MVRRKNICAIHGMEILRKEKSPFNEVPSPKTERGSVGIHTYYVGHNSANIYSQ